MTVGEKIRARRLELGMTMEELGSAIGVQRSAINKYEKGMITNLKRSTIAALAEALQVSPIYLIDDDAPISYRRVEVKPGKSFARVNEDLVKAQVKTAMKEITGYEEPISVDLQTDKMMKLWKVATPEARRLAIDCLKVSAGKKGK